MARYLVVGETFVDRLLRPRADSRPIYVDGPDGLEGTALKLVEPSDDQMVVATVANPDRPADVSNATTSRFVEPRADPRITHEAAGEPWSPAKANEPGKPSMSDYVSTDGTPREPAREEDREALDQIAEAAIARPAPIRADITAPVGDPRAPALAPAAPVDRTGTSTAATERKNPGRRKS